MYDIFKLLHRTCTEVMTLKIELTSKEKAQIIGKRLLDLREKKCLERKEVADAIGVTVSAISNYELGIRVPRDEAKYALAKYYGVDLGEIFYCF